MTADLEVELKLEADPADLDRLADAAVLRDAALVAKSQVATYFDTPAQALRTAGLSLRIRRTGERRVQTVKAGGSAAAGLFARPEWEREVAGDTPELDAAGGPIASLIPPAALSAIAPAFTMAVTRRTGLVRHAGALIEVVLDAGTITAANREAPIGEAELELKEGEPAALFALARALAAVAPLRLGVRAKSERGYALMDERAPRAIKAGALELAADATAAEAFAAIAGACIRQFRLNEAILLTRREPDALHQARVALRRLRSALSIFKPMLADERLEVMRGELRWLAATLGDARDLDVLAPRVEAALRPALEAARAGAYEAVEAALHSARARGLMLDLSEWIAIGRWRVAPCEPELCDQPASRFAAETLDRLRRRMRKRGRDLEKLSDEARHEVRILAKKLRYASEFFAGLFTGKAQVRRARRFLAALEDLQKHLGELNDIAHGPTVLARLGIDAGAAAPSIDRRTLLIQRAADAQDALIDSKRFWR